MVRRLQKIQMWLLKLDSVDACQSAVGLGTTMISGMAQAGCCKLSMVLAVVTVLTAVVLQHNS